jgi:hypothetical protein
VTIEGTCVALAWDVPMEGVERPWFVCPGCGRRCRHMYLRDTIGCRQCHRLDYASRHLRRQTPGVGRVERLRRKLGDGEVKPFAPLPTRIRRARGGRSRAFHDALVARILDEEAALLGHLQTVTGEIFHERLGRPANADATPPLLQAFQTARTAACQAAASHRRCPCCLKEDQICRSSSVFNA